MLQVNLGVNENAKNVIVEVANKIEVPLKQLSYKVILEKNSSGERKSIEIDDSNYELFISLKNASITSEIKKEEVKLNEPIYIEISNDGIYLTVNEKSMSIKDIINYVILKDIYEPQLEEIEKAGQNRGVRTKIAEYNELWYQEPYVTIEISPNKMEGYIIIGKSGFIDFINVDKVKKKMLENGIVSGIDEEAVKKAIKESKRDEKILVARGTFSEHGKDGYIKYFFNKNTENFTPQENEDGTIDFRHLNIFETTTAGRELARKIMPSSGKEGITVTGERMYAVNGIEAVVIPGKNTKLSDDNMSIISTANGMIKLENHKIDVYNVFITPEVGIYTGDIVFDGGIVVQNDVKTGYSLTAAGDIQILGNAERTHIKAGGKIMINGTFFGADIGTISAGNDIVAKYIDSAIVESKSGVTVGEGIRNTRVVAGGLIKTVGPKSAIVGGDLTSGTGFEIINCGSASGTPTYLNVGANPKLREELKKCEAELIGMEKKNEEIEKNIVYMEKVKNSGIKMDENKISIFQSLIKAKFSAELYIKELKLRINEIRRELEERIDVKITIMGKCYPGVVITIRNKKYVVENELKKVCFYYEDDQVKFKNI